MLNSTGQEREALTSEVSKLKEDNGKLQETIDFLEVQITSHDETVGQLESQVHFLPPPHPTLSFSINEWRVVSTPDANNLFVLFILFIYLVDLFIYLLILNTFRFERSKIFLQQGRKRSQPSGRSPLTSPRPWRARKPM